MAKRTRDHQTWLIEKLTNPSRASEYLNAAREDSREMFLEALRDVAQARQMAKVARNAGVTRESLYRATSEIGNPTLETLDSVLAALGIAYRFVPVEAEEQEQPSASIDAHSFAGLGLAATTVASGLSPIKGQLVGIGNPRFELASGAVGAAFRLPLVYGQPELTPVPPAFICQAGEPEHNRRHLR